MWLCLRRNTKFINNAMDAMRICENDEDASVGRPSCISSFSLYISSFILHSYLFISLFFLYIFLRFSVQESNKKKLSFISRKFERFLFLYFRFCSPCFSSFLSFYFLHYLFINRVINEIGFNIKLCSKVRIFLYKFWIKDTNSILPRYYSLQILV